MSVSVGSAQLDLGINYRQFDRQLGNISRRAETSVGSAFKKLGAVIVSAFAVKKITEFSLKLTKMGSDLYEVQNVVDTTFGNMSDSVNRFSKTAIKDLGMSQLAAKQFTSTMGAMLKSSGLAGEQMLEMSLGITRLTGDMSSFYNLEHEQMFAKIRSGISGETEPLKQLGINMSVANMEAFALSQGITKSYQAMSQAEQVLLRYNYLMSVTTDAQGDFIKTSAGWANQTRILSEQWKQFQTTLGQGFINVLIPVVRGLNRLMERLQLAAEYFREFTRVMTGQSKETQQSAKGVIDSSAGMVDSLESVGDASKKAADKTKGSLAGFDELNVIGDKAADSLEGVANSLNNTNGPDFGDATKLEPEIDTSGMERFKEVLSGIKSVGSDVVLFFKDQFGESFKSLFYGIADSAKKSWKTVITSTVPLQEWFAGDGLIMFQEYAVGVKSILEGLLADIKIIWDEIGLGIIGPAYNTMSTITAGMLDLIKKYWDNHGKSLIKGLKDLLRGITGLLLNLWNNILKPIWTHITSSLLYLWDNHLKSMLGELFSFIGQLAEDALTIINKFIIPIVNEFMYMFGPEIVKVINTVVDIVKYFLAILSDIIEGTIKVLRGLLDFVMGVFTLDWDRAWKGMEGVAEGFKKVFSGIIDGVIKIFKRIIDYVNSDFEVRWDNFMLGLKTITTMVWDSIKNVVKGVIDWIMEKVDAVMKQVDRVKKAAKTIADLPSKAVSGIKSGVSTFTSNFRTGLSEIGSKIPKFASGGIVSSPTLAMVGDNKNARNDPEVITPISKLSEMLGQSNQSVIEALMMILDAIEKQDTSLNIDGEKLARIMRDKIRDEDGRVGKSMVLVGGVRA